MLLEYSFGLCVQLTADQVDMMFPRKLRDEEGNWIGWEYIVKKLNGEEFQVLMVKSNKMDLESFVRKANGFLSEYRHKIDNQVKECRQVEIPDWLGDLGTE